jgi:hypothetical protein
LEADARNAVEGLQRNNNGSQAVDLPGGGTAPEAAITLPDTDRALGPNDLFPTFEGTEMYGADTALFYPTISHTKESLTMAQDISDIFGSRWTNYGEDEQFNIGSDNNFQVELERLRAQAADVPQSAGRGLFFEPSSGEPPAPGEAGHIQQQHHNDDNDDDEMMEAPPDDLFPIVSAGPTPGSGPALSSGQPVNEDFLIAGGELPDVDVSEGFMYDGDDVGGDDGGSYDLGALGDRLFGAAAADGTVLLGEDGAVSGHRKAPAGRKRRAVLDLDPGGRPNTDLPQSEVKSLIKDWSLLLKPRGLRARHRRLEQSSPPPRPYDVPAQFGDDVDQIFKPVDCQAINPDMLNVFRRALTFPDGSTSLPDERRNRAALMQQRKKEAEEAAAAAAAAAAADNGDGLQPSAIPNGGGDLYDDDGDVGGDFFDDGGGDGYDDMPAPQDFPPLDEAGTMLAGPSSAQRDPLDLQPTGSVGGRADSGGSLLVEEREEEEGVAGDGVGVTERTRMALFQLQKNFAGSAGSKRRHPSTGGADAGIESLSLNEMMDDKKTRLEACRLFYQMLVLQGQGFVEMEQEEAYGDISIKARDKLLLNTE